MNRVVVCLANGAGVAVSLGFHPTNNFAAAAQRASALLLDRYASAMRILFSSLRTA